jgi:hypothetical protein
MPQQPLARCERASLKARRSGGHSCAVRPATAPSRLRRPGRARPPQRPRRGSALPTYDDELGVGPRGWSRRPRVDPSPRSPHLPRKGGRVARSSMLKARGPQASEPDIRRRALGSERRVPRPGRRPSSPTKRRRARSLLRCSCEQVADPAPAGRGRTGGATRCRSQSRYERGSNVWNDRVNSFMSDQSSCSGGGHTRGVTGSGQIARRTPPDRRIPPDV